MQSFQTSLQRMRQHHVKNVEETLTKKPRWELPNKKNALTPMSTSFESELDGSPELNENDRTYYQELIGALRWATELGRVDILLEVSLLSQYQACPREGHMEQLLRIFGFLKYHLQYCSIICEKTLNVTLKV